MWDYIAHSRQSDLRREAAARRFARFTRSEHYLTPIRFIRSLITRFSFGIQPRRQMTARPPISALGDAALC